MRAALVHAWHCIKYIIRCRTLREGGSASRHAVQSTHIGFVSFTRGVASYNDYYLTLKRPLSAVPLRSVGLHDKEERTKLNTRFSHALSLSRTASPRPSPPAGLFFLLTAPSTACVTSFCRDTTTQQQETRRGRSRRGAVGMLQSETLLVNKTARLSQTPRLHTTLVLDTCFSSKTTAGQGYTEHTSSSCAASARVKETTDKTEDKGGGTTASKATDLLQSH